MQNFIHSIPVEIHFGSGCSADLAKVKLPGKKPLLVISGGNSMRRYGILDTVCAALARNNCIPVIFDRIKPNPTLAGVAEGAEAARKHGCDFVIGLGGGSSLDSAKAIAVSAVNDGSYWEYVKGRPIAGALPMIAIPTTAGTGTEADPWAVITNEETREKVGSGWRETFPVYAFVDPDFMLHIPPELTAYQGFDAFFHAAEGFVANIANPVSDIYAAESMSLLFKHLPGAVRDGKNLEARTKVALASTLAGMVESTSSCISQHALEHAMSAFAPSLPHGAGLIMLSQAFFGCLDEKIPRRMDEMAYAITRSHKVDFTEILTIMQASCGVAGLKMSDYGLTRAMLPELLCNARSSMPGIFNFDPVKLTDAELLDIYKESFK